MPRRKSPVASQPTDADNTPQLLRASDHPAHPVEWLWPEKIPIGKVSLIIGDPGLGKSLLALDIAARLSRASSWPTTNNETATSLPSSNSSLDIRHSSFPTPSSTLLLSANDDLADTIRPRLDAAGADPSRIYVLNSVTDLRTEFAKLRAAIDSAPDCRLLIIDPINAYVGPGDSHFHSVVRKVLAPLAELAAEKRIAVVAIAHLRKTEGAAIYRAAGSMGFVASARVIWTVSRDPEDSSRQLLLPLKNNLTATACGLAYSITSEPGSGAPAIAWHASPIDMSSEHGLSRGEAADLHAVRIWLRKALANGPRSASDIKEAGQQFDFQERTLRRALHAIGGTTQNRGIIDGWWWSLGSPPTPPQYIAEPSRLGAQPPRTESPPPPTQNPKTHSPFPTPNSTFSQPQHIAELSRLGAQPPKAEPPLPQTQHPNTHSPFPTPNSPLVHPQKPVPLCPLPRISPSVARKRAAQARRDALAFAKLAAMTSDEFQRAFAKPSSRPKSERPGDSAPPKFVAQRVAGAESSMPQMHLSGASAPLMPQPPFGSQQPDRHQPPVPPGSVEQFAIEKVTTEELFSEHIGTQLTAPALTPKIVSSSFPSSPPGEVGDAGTSILPPFPSGRGPG
jgi:hypothetical protein